MTHAIKEMIELCFSQYDIVRLYAVVFHTIKLLAKCLKNVALYLKEHLKILFTKTAIFMTVEYMLWLKIIILTSKCTVPTEIKNRCCGGRYSYAKTKYK